MRNPVVHGLALVAAVLVPMACRSGAGVPDATVTATFPNLFDQGGTKVLPTYISHVTSSTTFPLVSINVQNTGSGTTSFTVSLDLPTYGSPAAQTVSIAAGQARTIKLSPIIDYTTLFGLTTAVPAALDVTVTAGTTSLFQQTYPIEISGRDTVFWTNNGQNTAKLIATMVTPNDKALAITGLVQDAGLLFSGGTLLGYQAGGAFPPTSFAMNPGSYKQEQFNVLAGESPTVMIDDVVDGLGASAMAAVYIFDDASFTTWSGGGTAIPCAGNASAAAGTVVTCPTPTPGIFHIVYYNPSSSSNSRTVTRHRPMMNTESTYYQSEAIFLALRNRGLSYASLPGADFFSTAQDVMYPSESLSTLNASCLEGMLVFASAWERMGMQPLLFIDYAHGHAFVAVRCWTDTSCVIPVETTMVGGTATFDASYSTASASWNAWGATGDNSATIIDLAAARALGLVPAPM
jgi:hypothetical protein